MSSSAPQPPTGAPGTWKIDWTNLLLRSRRFQMFLARRWPVALICTVLAGAAAAYWAVRSPDIYLAASRLGIAPRIQTAFHSQAQYQEELNNFYDSQLQYLTSSKVQARVEEQMRKLGEPPANLQLVTRAVKQPASFSLQVESTNLEYARQFATTWAREFLSFKTELRENAIGRTAASTRDDIIRYERNLEQARTALLEFQRKNNLGSAKETGDAAQQRLDKLEGDYQDIKTLRQRLENKSAEQLVNTLSVESTPAPPDSARAPRTAKPGGDPLAPFEEASRYGELKLRLKTLESERVRLQPTLKPKHPYLRKLESELRQLKQELTFQIELIEEKRLARIQSLKDDETSYLPLIEDLRRQVLSSRNIQYEFERLREEETNVKTVLHDLRKAEESLNATTADDALFHIVEEGVGSPIPVRPDRSKIVLTGLLLGLSVGLGLVYLLGRLDDRFESPDEIQAALEEPILAQLPNIDRRRLKLERLLLTSLAEHHLYRESLRGLRSALFPGGEQRTRKLLLLTSAAPGEGKTTVSVNLASTLALAGHRVLLIDADLRRGDTHSFFGRKRSPGLSEILTGQLGWPAVLHTTELSTLHVIHSGELPRDPGELLLQPSLHAFLNEVRAQYDTILIDCPPLSVVDDTFTLASVADGLLFIVRANQTSMRLAARSLDALRQRGAPLQGLILNALTANNPYYYYHHYYYGSYAQPQVEEGQTKAPKRAA